MTGFTQFNNYQASPSKIKLNLPTMQNPYYEEFKQYCESECPPDPKNLSMKKYMEQLSKMKEDPLQARCRFTNQYAWSIPTEEAVNLVIQFAGSSRIIDMACGTGYWSWLFAQKGANVVAIDDGSEDVITVDDDGSKIKKPIHFEDRIMTDGIQFLKLTDTAQDCMFLSWARTIDFVNHFKGDKLVIVGENIGGCTASLPKNSRWELTKNFKIPTWSFVHDTVSFYTRGHNK
ncbi:MAG: class I SAM-dependent methyltransferase [Sphingobacteriaceae bacterium]|nr:MAG: class I SAM-dependent methyltransferase [Sphingobacteriaceae bacterium]